MEEEEFNPTKVTGLEFSSIDGIVTYRVIYADGRKGPTERTNITLGEPDFKQKRNELYRQLDLKPPTDGADQEK